MVQIVPLNRSNSQPQQGRNYGSFLGCDVGFNDWVMRIVLTCQTRMIHRKLAGLIKFVNIQQVSAHTCKSC